MKKLLAILMAICLGLTAAALAESEMVEDWPVDDNSEDSWLDAEQSVGAWESCDLITAKGNDNLRKLLEKATAELTGVTYTPIALLGTHTASGTNYCSLCHCTYTTQAAENGWSLVYLSQSLGGEVEVSNIVNLDIASLSDYGIFH